MIKQPISLQQSVRILLLASLLIPFSVSAQELFTQEVTPTTTAYELSSSPTIDGEVLGDNAWSVVTPTVGFSQLRPEEGHPASQKT